MASKIEKMKSTASAAPREVPEVKPDHVQVNEAGQVWRTVLARMPDGLVSDDLRNPAIWKKVQLSRHAALIKMDRLFILGHDESWGAEAIVKRATSAEVSLAILKVFAFREADETLFSDGTLEVYWDGASYGVRRISDHVRVVSHGFKTEALASDALRKTYPTKAA